MANKKKPVAKKAAKTPAAGAPAGKSGGASEALTGETVDVSQETLDATPARALQFLRGIGTSRVIRATLHKHGYTQEEHALGWKLLQAASGFRSEGASPAEDREAADAAAILDAWDEPGFRIAKASLKHRFPRQYAFVFDGLEASKGFASVLGVETFLDRLDALEGAPERAKTRKQDLDALAALAARGIPQEERQRLRALVEKARKYGDDDDAPEQEQAAEQAASRATLLPLRAWYEEWSEIARARISRKDYLIRLGLAQRKKPKKEPPPAG